jgi:hypothetical protein
VSLCAVFLALLLPQICLAKAKNAKPNKPQPVNEYVLKAIYFVPTKYKPVRKNIETIKDYIKARKSKNLISEEIKLIGLSSTLICLVLTQAAILSISNENDNTFTNRQAGIIFGCISALVGVYMMIRSKYLKNSYGEEETRT